MKLLLAKGWYRGSDLEIKADHWIQRSNSPLLPPKETHLKGIRIVCSMRRQNKSPFILRDSPVTAETLFSFSLSLCVIDCSQEHTLTSILYTRH